MGLFNKKNADKSCSVCGGELGKKRLGGAVRISDGTICENCAVLLRGDYPLAQQVRIGYATGARVRTDADPLAGFTAKFIRELIEEKYREQEKIREQYQTLYRAVLTVDYVGIASPRIINAGFLRSHALENKVIVRGFVHFGTFSSRDEVLILHGEDRMPSDILDCVRCYTCSDLMNMVNEQIHFSQVEEGENAWLVLNAESGVRIKDKIVKIETERQ
ncbi:MAG: hypothetical protein K6B40_08800 [Firmicutes bacterium]|nr:hypothetical protein [Bacillota bacterium]